MTFGLAIQVTDAEHHQLHTAALYRFNGELKIGDVQSHLRSRRDLARPSETLFWIAPDISNEEQRILAARIDAWLDTNANRIPYSVAHPGGIIFRDNVWVGDEPGQGLTCATFIVELFNELGIPFIDVASWQQRPDDAEWAERILGMLSASMSKEHADAQRARIGDTIRIRPSDIAAAGHLLSSEMDMSLTFSAVDPVTKAIEHWLFPA